MGTQMIWLVYTEVRPVGDEAQDVPRTATDVFVECYVPTSSIETALQRARQALACDGYQVVDIDKCFRFDPDEWDDENDPEREVRDSADEASEEQEVVYGIFRWCCDPSGNDE